MTNWINDKNRVTKKTMKNKLVQTCPNLSKLVVIFFRFVLFWNFFPFSYFFQMHTPSKELKVLAHAWSLKFFQACSKKTLNLVSVPTQVLIWITRVRCFWNYPGFSGSVLTRVPSLLGTKRVFSLIFWTTIKFLLTYDIDITSQQCTLLQ